MYWIIHEIAGSYRYLDKFPRHSLRVPYLNGLFPDAHFVFMRRDGRATVSSMITGWRTGRFPADPTERIALTIRGFDGYAWQFEKPPGWQTYTKGSHLEEVCAFQWVSANEAALDASAGIGSRWHDVVYEDLVRRPVEVTRALLDGLGLPAEQAVLDFAASLGEHVTKVAVTPPDASKWRRENPSEIARVIPLIAPTMVRLGYPDPRTESERGSRPPGL
jgi:hypothetical protein